MNHMRKMNYLDVGSATEPNLVRFVHAYGIAHNDARLPADTMLTFEIYLVPS